MPDAHGQGVIWPSGGQTTHEFTGRPKVFDQAGLAAFTALVQASYAAATESGLRHRRATMLRTLYLEQQDLSAYCTLADATGVTTADCFAIATMLLADQRALDAIDWVERGFGIPSQLGGESSKRELSLLKRAVLIRLGRIEEALAAAWEDFCKLPCVIRYRELMDYVAGAERGHWHERALAATVGASLSVRFELLLETAEFRLLATVVCACSDQALVDMSHYQTEPVAIAMESEYPGVAARLWRAQGLRIVNAGKSGYYTDALDNFTRAKECFERADQAHLWQQTVECIRRDHRRKHSFMPDFERVVAGQGNEETLSYLDRAKARWNT